MEAQVLGMPLDIDLGDDNYTVSPVCALVVMKGIDSNGAQVVNVALTEGVTALEGLGFADFARCFYEFQLRKTFYDITD